MGFMFNKAAGKLYFQGRLPFGYEFGYHLFMGKHYWKEWGLSFRNPNSDNFEIDLWAGPLMRLHVWGSEDG